MRKVSLWISCLFIASNLFSQTNEKVVLEPVGRYIYQAYKNNNAGIDHLLNATGLSDGRILVTGVPALAIVKVSDMTVTGSQDFQIRASRGGGRDVVVYNDEYIYVNNHQSEGRTATFGFGINQITETGITTLTGVSETDVFFEKMKIYGDYLYVAAHDQGFRIYSLANPKNPSPNHRENLRLRRHV